MFGSTVNQKRSEQFSFGTKTVSLEGTPRENSSYVTVVDENGHRFSVRKDSSLWGATNPFKEENESQSWADRIRESNNKIIEKNEKEIDDYKLQYATAESIIKDNKPRQGFLERLIHYGNLSEDEKQAAELELNGINSDITKQRFSMTSASNGIYSNHMSIFCLTLDNSKYGA